MQRIEMTCETCVFSVVDEKDRLRCIERVPSDAWHMESLEDFPHIEPISIETDVYFDPDARNNLGEMGAYSTYVYEDEVRAAMAKLENQILVATNAR